MLAKRDAPQARRIWLTAASWLVALPAGDGPEEDPISSCGHSTSGFLDNRSSTALREKNFDGPMWPPALAASMQPDDAVEQVLLAAAGGCDSDGVEMGGAASGTGGTTADQGADHGDGGTEREHPVRTPAGRDDPVDDFSYQPRHGGEAGELIDRSLSV